MIHGMLVSLIVPTRERAAYLRECLRTAIAIDDPDIEIVVSDNASEDDTRAVVASFGDRRIRYLHTGCRLSMRQNFEFALEGSEGEYVIFIGDDDAFLPRQFAALRAVLEQGRPDLLSWHPLTYGWPVPGFGRRVGGVRFLRSRLLGLPREVPLDAGRRALLRGDLSRLGPKPTVYHGCVSRTLLETIRRRCGCCFGARSPDVFFSYYVMLTRPFLPFTRHSFTISGYSPVSTGNAHHAYSSTDPRSQPAKRFGRESANDPVQDAIRAYLPSLSLNMFSSFETARLAAGVDGREVDYPGWYRYVLGGLNPLDSDMVTQANLILEDYARSTGTSGDLERARIAGRPRRHSSVALSRLIDNLASVRCSAERDGTNTVRTAAEMVDDVLGDEYLAMARSGRESRLAWPRTYVRGVRCKMGV
jgi:glycosyltransferase involved in cell wall biosynthesis